MAIRHQGGTGRDPAAAGRPQRAFDDPGGAGLRPSAERICRARSGRSRPRRLCAENRQPSGKKGRTLLADSRGRDAEPARRPRRGSFGRGLQGRRQADPLSRLLLPHPHAAGRRRSGRRLRLSGEGQDERRLRADRRAGGIWQFRHHDLHGQSRRHRVSEGSRAEDRRSSQPRSTPSRRTRLGRRSTIRSNI